MMYNSHYDIKKQKTNYESAAVLQNDPKPP